MAIELTAVIAALIAAIASVTVAVIQQRANMAANSWRRQREEREAVKADLDLCMARIMLLDHYYRCVSHGFYSVEERDVYHQLFLAYKTAGGDGVIDEIAEKIVKLPTYKED